jgi:hypothetical protein
MHPVASLRWRREKKEGKNVDCFSTTTRSNKQQATSQKPEAY